MSKNNNSRNINKRPTIEEAQEAVKTLISWAGDNPNRVGLIETPMRVVKAYRDFFSGYDCDPKEILGKTFEDNGSDNDPNFNQQSLSSGVFQEKMEFLKRRREWIETISRRSHPLLI